MAPAADPLSPPPIASAENNFQPFFVLHKASPPRKSTAKTRRKIELSPKSFDSSPEKLRFETFRSHWSATESAVNEVLRKINSEVFDKIDNWIYESFNTIRACQTLDYTSVTRPYPFLNSSSISASVASHQIFTALLFTKNMEFVDDILTFVDLGAHLRSNGCHVANLTSLDFTAKNGVGGCLKRLLRQFLMLSIDAPDISILASWYAEQGNTDGNPMVVIVEDIERCCASVLSDFIIMLKEWLVKIPIILVLGVATTLDSLRSTLPSNACSYLSLCEFTLNTPVERMNAVIEAVLMKNCDSFGIGKQVSTFLRNYFLKHDGTLTFFIRALKIAMVQHVYMEPMMKRGDEKSTEPRCQQSSANLEEDLASSLSEVKIFRKVWSSLVMCMYEVQRYNKISLLDLYCDMLEPEVCKPSNHLKGGCVHRAIQIVRDLPAVELCKVLKNWEMHTSGLSEIHEKVMELQSLKIVDENRSKQKVPDKSKKPVTRNNIDDKMDGSKTREKFATFLEYIVRECMKSTEHIIPLRARFLFNNVDKLQKALIGDPRKRIQSDLLESQKFLKCSCCRKNDGSPLPSMHNTSIMYSLAQEHGDLINVHEWFHAFKAIVSPSPLQAKKKLRLSPSPKKRKERPKPQNITDASIQAEFCRAVTEMQITGLLRMPSKRRPDYVQRVAFGL